MTWTHDETGMLVNLNRCEYVGLWKSGDAPLAQVTGKHAVIAWTTRDDGGYAYVLWQGDDGDKAMDEFLAVEGKVTRSEGAA